jgi:hypothetical protein
MDVRKWCSAAPPLQLQAFPDHHVEGELFGILAETVHRCRRGSQSFHVDLHLSELLGIVVDESPLVADDIPVGAFRVAHVGEKGDRIGAAPGSRGPPSVWNSAEE